MGRKSNLKRIVRIAKQMPNVNMLDHKKNMVQGYNKNGASGVKAYMDAVMSAKERQIPFVPKEHRHNAEI